MPNNFLKENKEITNEIEKKIRDNYNQAFLKSIDAHVEIDDEDDLDT